MTLRMLGRCTLTATLVPSFNLATWTCAMEAPAMGFSEKLEEKLFHRLPSSFSTISRASWLSKGGTWVLELAELEVHFVGK